VLLVLATGLSWASYEHRLAKHLVAWDSRPLFAKEFRFNDLTWYSEKTEHLYHGAAELGRGEPTFNYPAPAAFVYKALLHTFPGHPVAPYLVFLGICVLAFAYVAYRAVWSVRSARTAVAAVLGVTAILGYPVWFAGDRGNIEGVVWALAGAGLCFLLRSRYIPAAILIGVAAAVKPFPILLLVLMVRRRRYGAAALGVVTAAVVMLAALTYLGPNPWKVYQELKPGISRYEARYVQNLAPVEEMRFDHSLLDGMKSAAMTVDLRGFRPSAGIDEVARLRSEPGGWHVVHRLARIYPLVAIAGFGLLLAVFYKKPMLNQMTALVAATTIFPLSSGEYTLLQMYVPFGALVVFLVREVATGRASLRFGSMIAFTAIYGLLFSPLTFLRMYAGDAKLLLLIALLVLAAWTPMRSAYFSDAEADEGLADGVAGVRSSASLASRVD
jgi:hypothetical protein